MKCVFMLCFVSALYWNVILADEIACISKCGSDHKVTGTSQTEVCKSMRSYLSCLQTSCKMNNLTSVIETLEDLLKLQGYTCDLSSSTAVPSASLLAVASGLLITVYSAFSM